MSDHEPLDYDGRDLDPDIPDDGEAEASSYEIERPSVKAALQMPIDKEWFVPGRDAKDSERMFIRVTPRYRDWLSSYTQDKRFPFKSMNHLIRWCIDQGLRKLDRIRPTPTLSTQVAAMRDLLYEEEVAAGFALLMGSAEQRVSSYLKDGARGEAIRVVGNLLGEIEQMPDGYWKGRYLREIVMRWGDLMESAGVGFEMPPENEGDEA